MKILALDTATEACSAALLVDGEIRFQYQLAPRQHSRLILTMMDDLLQEAEIALPQLDAIAFGRGPGSFMGIRIAAGVAQGIAFANETPVIPVSNLLAIAEVAYMKTSETNIMVAIDARMGEVYWGCFQRQSDGQWLVSVEELVSAPEQLVYPDSGQWVAAGTGWGSYAEVMLAQTDLDIKTVLGECLPSASAIVNLASSDYILGNTVAAAQAQPVYLRNNVARKPEPKTFASHLNLQANSQP